MKDEYAAESLCDQPILAICYDFDKTLTPKDMQAQGYIQTVYDNDAETFWKESNALASEHNMDQNLAYMYKMIQESRGREIFTPKKLREYGENIELYKGLPEWFDIVNEFGLKNGVVIEHYVISSGLKEIIEGSVLSKYFKEIYASQYFSNDKGECVWPAQVVNYTNKTQFLFRISKGYLNVNDERVNKKVDKGAIRIPFNNIVYIGDSETDIPCMKIVKEKGGHSIGVYEADNPSRVARIVDLYTDNRISFFADADYSIESDLAKYVFKIIESTKNNYDIMQLENTNAQFIEEYRNKYIQNSKDYAKDKLIDSLENSSSFAMTHMIIAEIQQYNEWSEDQIVRLCRAGVYNSQIFWILNDRDVKNFYQSLSLDSISDANVEKIKNELYNL